jgi:hypothetical protein
MNSKKSKDISVKEVVDDNDSEVEVNDDLLVDDDNVEILEEKLRNIIHKKKKLDNDDIEDINIIWRKLEGRSITNKKNEYKIHFINRKLLYEDIKKLI